jgi:hypothetical protein
MNEHINWIDALVKEYMVGNTIAWSTTERLREHLIEQYTADCRDYDWGFDYDDCATYLANQWGIIL